MTTRVRVNTATHTITFVTEELMRTMKEVIKLIGLDPTSMSWTSTENALNTWLTSRHLQKVTLEIFNPSTDALVARWDISIDYNHSVNEDENFWNDLDATKFAIAKAGVVPNTCKYRIVIDNKEGRPDVPGWSSTTYRSTDGFVKHGVGTTIGTSTIGAQTEYWRRQ